MFPPRKAELCRKTLLPAGLLFSHSVVSDFFATLWTVVSASLLCPWDFSGKNTGVDCHSLLQGTIQIQGLNPGLSHCGQIVYHLSHQWSPLMVNELLGWNSHPIGLVSSGRETPENSLCVSVSFPLSLFPTPLPCVRTQGEASLGRKNSYQNLTLLAPWSETFSPQNCEEINFYWLFH